MLGAGFIGTAVVKRLITDGFEVHVVTRELMVRDDLNDAHIHVGDIGDSALLNKLIKLCGTVVHVASRYKMLLDNLLQN